jgi:hypothetical protein
MGVEVVIRESASACKDVEDLSGRIRFDSPWSVGTPWTRSFMRSRRSEAAGMSLQSAEWAKFENFKGKLLR